MKFQCCTLIVDFKTSLVEHFIEKLLSIGIEVNIFTFNSIAVDEEVIKF